MLNVACAQSVDVDGANAEASNLSASNVLNQPQDAGASSLGHLPKPFGSNLFHGGFSQSRENGLNPGYVIQPGDSVSVRIWGAIDFNQSLMVDQQGNIFLPSVGPVMVGGVRNQNLNERVEQAVSTVFIDNVKVYTSLDTSQPVAVFVTGNVAAPGRYAGIPSNSILYFIDKAGGIDPIGGSYRQIELLRMGEIIESIDLYDFIREGQLVSNQFQDGDTILVKERGDAITVTGDVLHQAMFEMTGADILGKDILEIARLVPGVTHVAVTGIRDKKPFSAYLSVAEFTGMTLRNGDIVNFRIDQHDSVIVVQVEGSHLGPSQFTVPQNTRLHELLDFIEVDPVLADVNARNAEPSGRMVVSREGEIANVLLQSGDKISIPRASESVLLSGEILVSQAILHKKGLRALDYINRSGGFNQQAKTDRLVILHANGEVSTGKNPPIQAGDEIIVLPKVPVKNLQIASTITEILYNIAIATSVALQL